MIKAYVILAHGTPDHLYRMVRALDDNASSFYIHIDRRSDMLQFSPLSELGDKVQFFSRVKTDWALFGLVEATLNGLKAVKDSGRSFDSIILLSGQDYPIKNNHYINTFIKKSFDKIYMEYFTLPNTKKWKPNGGLYRVNKYFFGFKPHQRYKAKAANMMATIFPVLRRKHYADMVPYAGSMWWMINMKALNYILNFVRENPRYVKFHRHTFAADELFFQTILLNAPDGALSSYIINDDKHFIKWKEISSSHPEVLKKQDLPAIVSSPALFARKFDPSVDNEILDLIDKYCLGTITGDRDLNTDI